METRERKRIGSYQVVRHLGTGGMATVYEAIQEPGGLRAAVKVLHPTFAANKDIVSRFLSEGHASNLIDHPGVVKIFDSGQLSDGTTYLAMEYLDGVSLHERLNQSGGRLPEEVAVRIGRQLAEAMAALHEAKIIHRDLKPENVMLVPEAEILGGERAKLLDFGIAKLATEVKAPGAMPTRTGMLMGTPTYMAPEQCRGARGVDDRADVYALGVMLYQMVSGGPPFTSPGAAEVMAMHVFETPQPLRTRAPHVSPSLETLIHEMLSKPPGARPPMRIVAQRLGELTPRSASPDDHTLMTDARQQPRALSLDDETRHDGDKAAQRGIAELAAEMSKQQDSPETLHLPAPQTPMGPGGGQGLGQGMGPSPGSGSLPRQLPPGARTEIAVPQSSPGIRNEIAMPQNPRQSPGARTEIAVPQSSPGVRTEIAVSQISQGARTEIAVSQSASGLRTEIASSQSASGLRTEIASPHNAARSGQSARTVLSEEIPQPRHRRHALTRLLTPHPTVYMGPDGRPDTSAHVTLAQSLSRQILTRPLVLGLLGAALASVIAIAIYNLLH